MPRKTGYTPWELREDATNQDILDALGDKSLSDVVATLEEEVQVLRATHSGHELYLWEEEVDEGE